MTVALPTEPESSFAAGDLGPLEEISVAIESGAGLPEVLRAASRALHSALALVDSASHVLAVAAASPADERSLLAAGPGVEMLELRVADRAVGRLHMRPRGEPPAPASVRLVAMLIASEVERVRAPARASAAAVEEFVGDLVEGRLEGRAAIVARAAALGCDLGDGASALVVRVHPVSPVADDWRARAVVVAERGARAVVSGTIAGVNAAAPSARHCEVVVLVPDAGDGAGERAGRALLRELEASLHGFTFVVGCSRTGIDAGALHRTAMEALLAANVADAGGERTLLAFEDTGAYRLLLPAMTQDPAELQRFYAETVEPLVAYDEQYEADLVHTVEAFLEADGNVAATAQRLFTHRHTVRYRLERVKELSGLDVGSTDGREKLSLGLKAMRVLGIPAPRGPASERGAEAGHVPRGRKDR